MTVVVRTLTGPDLEAVLPDLAQLRIEIFRDWPYLYEGTLTYESRYLQTYRDSPGAVLIGAFDGGAIIGAATGTPLEDHAEDFGAAFAAEGIALDQVFYCAESVLLPEYRGRGFGHRFFDLREAHARALGRRYAAFCAVVRPDDHPKRPKAPRSLEPFWTARGYEKLPGVPSQYPWKDIGAREETAKTMQFWMRSL